MYINIEGILIQKKKSLAWLSKEIDCNYSHLWKISHNQVASINLDLLGKLCLILECGVENILVLDRR